MVSIVPADSADVNMGRLRDRYNEVAALTNGALSDLLAACAGLDADVRNNIVRAAIAYAEADHARRVHARLIGDYKRRNGIR